MRRHVFIVNDFPPVTGGQSSYLYHLCRALPPEAVTVLAPSAGDTAAFDAAQPFRVVRKPYLLNIPVVGKLLKVILPLFWVRPLLRGRPRPLLHCAHVLSTGFIGLALKAAGGTDYVIYTYASDILEYQDHPVWGFCLRRILGGARHVVTISRFTRRRLEALGVPPGRIVISPPRIDPEGFGPGPSDGDVLRRWGLEGKRYILSVNRLVERKGNDTVIRAMPALLERCPEIVYVILGSGPHAGALRRLARDMGSNALWSLLKGGDDARRALLAGCEIFVMVSRADEGRCRGFWLVYLEAGASAKAVVAGDSGGIRDAVEDGKSGLMVDPLDPAAAAAALGRLLADRGLVLAMGAYGRERVKAHFDFRQGVPELAPVFNEKDA